MTTESPNTLPLQIGNEPLDMLHGILAEEICQYEAVSERLTRKSQVLAANKPKQLAQIDRELLALSRKATQLEQERQRTMAQIGCPNWSLTELIAHLPPQQARRFTQSRERLRQADHARLGGRVVGLPAVAGDARHRRQSDDAAARTDAAVVH